MGLFLFLVISLLKNERLTDKFAKIVENVIQKHPQAQHTGNILFVDLKQNAFFGDQSSRYKRYYLSDDKDFSSLFFPENNNLLKTLEHFEKKSGEPQVSIIPPTRPFPCSLHGLQIIDLVEATTHVLIIEQYNTLILFFF